MIIFNNTLSEFAGKYLVTNPNVEQNAQVAAFGSEYKKALASIVEQLVFFDKVSIKVYGENIPLIVLINELGLHQVFDLIEDGTIEFLLWTPALTIMAQDDPNLVGKLNPLQSGNFNSPVHSDPHESVKQGLTWMQKQLDRKVRREIERKAVNSYKITKPEFARDAAEIVTNAYSANRLADVGMPNTKDARLLDYDERFRLLGFGDEILETTILANFQYSSLGNYRYYDLSKQSIHAIKAATNALAGLKEVFDVEKLPGVWALVEAGEIDLKELIKLRQRPVSKKFREWLASHTSDDSEYITKQYINEVATHKGILQTTGGKFIKTMGVYGIGFGIGAAIDGMTGGIVGAVGAELAKNGAELGLSLIDTYFFDGLLKGWHPKLFVNEYEKLIKGKSQPIKKTE